MSADKSRVFKFHMHLLLQDTNYVIVLLTVMHV